MKIIVVEGGIGRGLWYTAFIPELSKEGKIIMMSSYPQIYENFPGVYRSLGRNSQYAWEDIVMKEDNEIIFYDPYFNSEFIHKKIHVLDAIADGFKLERKPRKPTLSLNQEFINNAKGFKKENPNFIVVQFTSGQSPYAFDPKKPYINHGFERNISHEKASEIVKTIKDKYPNLTILLFALPNEIPAIEGTIRIDAPYLFYAALLKESLGFIGINSSLTHMAAAVDVKGIALWTGSSHKQWGYEDQINISGTCEHGNPFCTRPYLRELGDFIGSGEPWKCKNPTCSNVSSDLILKELDKLIPKEIKEELRKTPIPKAEQVQQPCETCK
jgi:ADP-heptose:LPS heptosyltransferase